MFLLLQVASSAASIISARLFGKCQIIPTFSFFACLFGARNEAINATKQDREKEESLLAKEECQFGAMPAAKMTYGVARGSRGNIPCARRRQKK